MSNDEIGQMNEAKRSVFWYLVGCSIEDSMKLNKDGESNESGN